MSGTAASEWRRNWKVVLAALAGMALSSLPSYSPALLYGPFEQEFGWARADVASAHLISAFAGIAGSPFIGSLIDRFGPRRIGIAAAITICLAMPLVSLVGPDIWTWRAFFVVLCIPIVLIQPMVWTSAITSLFEKGRGLALAVTLCGSGIGSIITPPLTFELIERFGWRNGFIVLSSVWALLSIPLIVFFFSSARDRARKVKTEPLPHTDSWKEVVFGEMLGLRFLKLVLAGYCFAVVAVPAVTQMVPILASNGIHMRQAAYIAGFIGFASITGRLTIGLLLDRMPARFIAMGCLILPVIGSLILIHNPGSIAAAGLAVVLFGLALGAELDIMAYMTSRYCKVGNFGMLFGIVGGAIGVAGASGPVALNAVYDSTGSYVLALWGMIPVCILAALLFLSLGPYPHPELHRHTKD